MPMFLDLVDALNWIVRAESFLFRFAYGDWKGAAKAGGPAGVVGELGRALVGANDWEFRIPRDAGWSGLEIEQFLKRYGIVVWARRVTGTHLVFSVKERQANWAEYLLRRRGIPVDSAVFNPANLKYAQQHAPGDQPPAWADQEPDHKSAADRLLDWLP